MKAPYLSSAFSIFVAALWLGAIPDQGSAREADRYEEMGWGRLMVIPDFPTEIAREEGSQDPVSLIHLEDPAISEIHHLVAGSIRYEGVEGVAYLEMWTVYSEEERYFSRTLGDFGPMAKLAGSSKWRPIMLPFQGIEGRTPIELEINLILPGGGKVEFKDFALYQSAESRGGGWWSTGEGVAGGNITGVAVLVLMGFGLALSFMGKARPLAIGLMGILLAGGVAAMVAGVVAVITGQSVGVWVPLVVCGLVAAIGGAVGLPLVKRAYLKHELRRMSAVDRIT